MNFFFGCLASTSLTCLTVDNLTAVYDAVYPARVRWYEIGMGLKVDIETLDAIKKNNTSTGKYLFITLQKWFQNGIDCYWTTLKKVVESLITVEHTDLESRSLALNFGRGMYLFFKCLHLSQQIIK